ncbi:unnamed protein product [Closterium sp. Naga37s-1]|nr:unnamed protein product [Closterium sp. Naga37s-1]
MSSSQSSQSDGLAASAATPPEASGGAPAEPQAGSAQAAKAPFKMPTPEEMAAQEMMNHCGVRTVISGVMGGGMGVMMGLLFGALDQPLHVEEMSTRQQLVHGFKQMAQRSWHTGKTFAVMGAIFSASECMAEKARARHDEVNTVGEPSQLECMAEKARPGERCQLEVGCRLCGAKECMAEKARARHDEVNTVIAGCVTGGGLSARARAGPQAACMGCAGFAAFSLLIEKVLERYQ